MPVQSVRRVRGFADLPHKRRQLQGVTVRGMADLLPQASQERLGCVRCKECVKLVIRVTVYETEIKTREEKHKQQGD